MSIKTGKNCPSFIVLALSCCLFFSKNSIAQDYPHDTLTYPFIEWEKNKLHFPGDSSEFKSLFNQFNDIIFNGEGQLDFVHMGGSHIQAGIFSARMRTQFQKMQPGLNSYRGYLFPYSAARTNNPSNYHIRYSGYWDYCKNVERKKDCKLGLSGMSITTNSENSNIRVHFNEDFPDNGFRSVKVFYEKQETSLVPNVNDSTFERVEESDHYTEFIFAEDQDSLVLSLEKVTEDQQSFTLYALKFENELPGFAYHAVGVNGASVPSYLRCELLDEHMADINPNLLILSIGINDAYGTRFSKTYFKNNYRELIDRIKEVSPNVKIIFTTNNDSYYRRRYPNKNGLEVREAMFELAKEYDAAVWDMFEVMGGLGSVSKWEDYGLAKSDKIHFTPAGYKLVGEMFFSAIVKAYEPYIKELED